MESRLVSGFFLPSFDFPDRDEKSWPSSSELTKFLFFMSQSRVFPLSKLTKLTKLTNFKKGIQVRLGVPLACVFARQCLWYLDCWQGPSSKPDDSIGLLP